MCSCDKGWPRVSKLILNLTRCSRGERGAHKQIWCAVTVVSGLQLLPAEEKKDLLKKMKNAVAGGGNLSDDGKLEVQGEHAQTVCASV